MLDDNNVSIETLWSLLSFWYTHYSWFSVVFPVTLFAVQRTSWTSRFAFDVKYLNIEKSKLGRAATGAPNIYSILIRQYQFEKLFIPAHKYKFYLYTHTKPFAWAIQPHRFQRIGKIKWNDLFIFFKFIRFIYDTSKITKWLISLFKFLYL